MSACGGGGSGVRAWSAVRRLRGEAADANRRRVGGKQRSTREGKTTRGGRGWDAEWTRCGGSLATTGTSGSAPSDTHSEDALTPALPNASLLVTQGFLALSPSYRRAIVPKLRPVTMTARRASRGATARECDQPCFSVCLLGPLLVVPRVAPSCLTTVPCATARPCWAWPLLTGGVFVAVCRAAAPSRLLPLARGLS